jgi:hypothetical protein
MNEVMNDVDYGRQPEKSPIEKMVGSAVEVTSGFVTIYSMLMKVGTHYRVAYGPVRIEFLESDIANFDRHTISLVNNLR